MKAKARAKAKAKAKAKIFTTEGTEGKGEFGNWVIERQKPKMTIGKKQQKRRAFPTPPRAKPKPRVLGTPVFGAETVLSTVCTNSIYLGAE